MDQLTTARGYIERQSKRVREADEEIEKLQTARAEMQTNLDEAKQRLEKLEVQARTESRQNQGADKLLGTLCADLASLAELTKRKKARTEESQEATEAVPATQDAAMTPPSEEVKQLLIQLGELGQKLKGALVSTAPTQPA